jgi:regulator of sigma E protease
LDILITPIGFILILSLLVFVHELGHFVVAKRSQITVEEFAIGFPPRALKLWQDEGQITLDGHDYIIGKKTNVSRSIQPGAQVYAETTIDEQGRPAIARLELIEPPKGTKPEKDETPTWLRWLIPPPPPPDESLKGRPTVTVDTLIRPTEYVLNCIPLGGYVRMVGEEDPTAPNSFASKSKRIRLAVLAAGSFMNLLAAIFFFTLTSLSGVPEPVSGLNLAGEMTPAAKTVITHVAPNSPAAQAGLQVDDAIIGAGEAKFEHGGDFASYLQTHPGQQLQLKVEQGQEIATVSVTPNGNTPVTPKSEFDQVALGLGIGYQEYPLAQTVVTALVPGAPADQAGLRPGDIILGIGAIKFEYAGELIRAINRAKGTEITLQLERDGQTITSPPLVPRVNPPAGEGAMGVQIAYNFESEITYYPLHVALGRGIVTTAEYVALTFYAPYAIIKDLLPAEAARPTGPVGIYQQTDSAVGEVVDRNWWFPVFWLTAVLSTALAVMNMLPLPALDGGRILFILIEAVRGRRIAPEKEGAIHLVGLAMLLMLMVVITYYDVSNPVPVIDWASLRPE